jgi:hypothetical protein
MLVFDLEEDDVDFFPLFSGDFDFEVTEEDLDVEPIERVDCFELPDPELVLELTLPILPAEDFELFVLFELLPLVDFDFDDAAGVFPVELVLVPAEEPPDLPAEPFIPIELLELLPELVLLFDVELPDLCAVAEESELLLITVFELDDEDLGVDPLFLDADFEPVPVLPFDLDEPEPLLAVPVDLLAFCEPLPLMVFDPVEVDLLPVADDFTSDLEPLPKADFVFAPEADDFVPAFEDFEAGFEALPILDFVFEAGPDALEALLVVVAGLLDAKEELLLLLVLLFFEIDVFICLIFLVINFIFLGHQNLLALKY